MICSCLKNVPSPAKPDNREIFKTKISRLVEKTIQSIKNAPYEFMPSIVVSESLLKSSPFTQLEEHVVKQINRKVLKKSGNLTLKNWFELRFNKPLTGNSGMPVYVVHVDRNETLKTVHIYISLRQDGNEIHKNLGEIQLDYSSDSIASLMDNPIVSDLSLIPYGHPSRPYKELENFSYGLIQNVLDRFKKTGISVKSGKVAENEISVYVDIDAAQEISGKIQNLIGKSLKHSLRGGGLFRCSFDREDFRKALGLITQYQVHGAGHAKVVDVSKFKDLLYDSASILFLIDIDQFDDEKYKISTRAYWLAKPKETDKQETIKTNEAGTYLAVFFDYAYILKQAFEKNTSFKMLTDENDYCLVETMGTACMEIQGNKEKVCEKALKFARINAAEGTSKWFLSRNPNSQKLDLYRHSTVIEDTINKTYEWSDDFKESCCQVTIKARVKPVLHTDTHDSNFQVYYFGKNKDENEFFSIENGSYLHSGDAYKIIFQPDKNSYVYVLQLDSSGKLNRLFPMVRYQDKFLNNTNPVKKGKMYHIPAQNGVFELDNNKGDERIYFIVSERPNKQLETIKFSDSIYDNDEAVLEKFWRHSRKRGVAKIILNPSKIYSWNEGMNVFSTFDQRLEKVGVNCINILKFKHK